MSINQLEVHVSPTELRATLAEDARRGLSSMPKSLPPKYFYNAHGSALFEQITQLPEYYLTRAELGILTQHAPSIGEYAGSPRTLIELGSGSSAKTRLLLDGLQGSGLDRYVPVDVSPTALEQAVEALAVDYPALNLHPIVADFESHLDRLPTGERRLFAFLGSTVGNLGPAQRHRFLAALRGVMHPNDALLLGADLVKSQTRLLAAYDDAAGVTAEFNRNVLQVLNHSLGADFCPERFDHVAIWNPHGEWIEMRLRGRVPMTVNLADLGLRVTFAAGEELRTEISAKFRRVGLEAELTATGFQLVRWWTDPADDFAVALARPA